jgi:hypothetical protein
MPREAAPPILRPKMARFMIAFAVVISSFKTSSKRHDNLISYITDVFDRVITQLLDWVTN